MTVRVLPYGPGGWLAEVDAANVVGFAAAVRRRADPEIAEVVPAARTVMVRLADPNDTRARDAVASWLADIVPEPPARVGAGEAVEIPVIYDGDDLADVAAACDLSVEEVVALHAAPTYVCAFCGFAPGFAYLTGVDERLVLPRRSTPRTGVPAGSVAIASEYSAVYPSPSPGGWHLLGRTDLVLWDPSRSRPATVVPGSTVRFVVLASP
jgi:KipI family sensor histidine kinase inhibitor